MAIEDEPDLEIVTSSAADPIAATRASPLVEKERLTLDRIPSIEPHQRVELKLADPIELPDRIEITVQVVAAKPVHIRVEAGPAELLFLARGHADVALRVPIKASWRVPAERIVRGTHKNHVVTVTLSREPAT